MGREKKISCRVRYLHGDLLFWWVRNRPNPKFRRESFRMSGTPPFLEALGRYVISERGHFKKIRPVGPGDSRSPESTTRSTKCAIPLKSPYRISPTGKLFPGGANLGAGLSGLPRNPNLPISPRLRGTIRLLYGWGENLPGTGRFAPPLQGGTGRRSISDVWGP